MALSPMNYLFPKKDKNTRNAWGHIFQLTLEHPTLEDLRPLKFSYDKLGDDALDRINEISPPTNSSLPRNNDRNEKTRPDEKLSPDASIPIPKRDLYAILRDNADDPVLSKLWQQINHVPDWVDWEQLERGQDVFYRYGGPNLTGLAWQSLLGGLGSARVVETLARTGGFRTSVVRHRLYETTQHILQVTQSLDSLKPGGDGHISSVKVRLLHAAVRRRIMTLVETRPSYYDVEANGVPINDLDCLGTISSFSTSLVWLSLPAQGIFLRAQEIEDYMALWKYVGYLTGCPVEHIETPHKAKLLMESLLMTEIKPTETSRILAMNMLDGLAGQPPQMASKDFLVASARWLNGNKLCDELGLPQTWLWYKSLVVGQCIFFMFMCYTYRSVPWLDRRKVRTLKRLFWLVIVEGKFGLKQRTDFDFKYIPDFHKTTQIEGGGKVGIAQRGIERRNFFALAVSIGALGTGLVIATRLVQGVLDRVLW